MEIDTIYRHLSGYDMELEKVDDFVVFVKQLEGTGSPFAIYKKTTGIDVGEEAIAKELRNPKVIVGFGGPKTYPFISDPDEQIKGAIAIIGRTLVYSERGIPLHQMRDAYTWAYSEINYFIKGTYFDVVNAFANKGYPIFRSPDLRDYLKKFRFTLGDQISFQDVLRN